MNVLVIPEDFRKDQYILKPVISKMFESIGRKRARIKVCPDPLLGGVTEATKWERIEEILDMYRGMVQVFLLIVDRDGVKGRRKALDRLEKLAGDSLGDTACLYAENAWQEIEVWALAGLNPLPKKWKWADVRAEIHAKETYFDPFAKERRLLNEPGQGRTTLGRLAGQNYKRVRSRCPEDIQALEERLKEWLSQN